MTDLVWASKAPYLPIDRQIALLSGETLPSISSGAALFADISGFTALTETLADALGPQRGAEELTLRLNAIYECLIAEVHRFGGSVNGFSGDAVTCWFDDQCPTGATASAAARAVACGLAIQNAMQQVADVVIPGKSPVKLAMKTSIASGTASRFLVGDPAIRVFDVLVGATISRQAAGERQAAVSETIVDEPTARLLGSALHIGEWRADAESTDRYAVAAKLDTPIENSPWPLVDLAGISDDQLKPWLLPAI